MNKKNQIEAEAFFGFAMIHIFFNYRSLASCSLLFGFLFPGSCREATPHRSLLLPQPFSSSPVTVQVFLFSWRALTGLQE